MKVCKFEKIKDEDDIKQVINCIRQEHPYVAVLPVLTQLQEWMQAISASWFHDEDEASHTTVNAIEEYCYSLTNHLNGLFFSYRNFSKWKSCFLKLYCQKNDLW